MQKLGRNLSIGVLLDRLFVGLLDTGNLLQELKKMLDGNIQGVIKDNDGSISVLIVSNGSKTKRLKLTTLPLLARLKAQKILQDFLKD